MKKEEILEFVKANPGCYLATVEDNQPHVRGMMMYNADEKGIVFHSAKSKDLSKQIMKNPMVEICFNSPKKDVQVRVKGKAVIKDDIEFKKEIVNTRPFLKPMVADGYDNLIVFQVVDCVAQIWTFETNLAPKTYIKISN